MESNLLEFIINSQDIEFALFDQHSHIEKYSPDIAAYFFPSIIDKNNAVITDFFPELVGYEVVLEKLKNNKNHTPLSINAIAYPQASFRPGQYIIQPPAYHNLQIHSYNNGLLAIIRNTTIEGFVEQEIVQRRNELDLLNSQLVNDLISANEQLNKAYQTTLEGWAKALEMRDLETRGHSQRVTKLTVQIAQMMGIDEENLLFYHYGALLHDIGKMGIPDHILLKPGSFNDEEKMIMQLHPIYAYQMLSPINYLRQALDIPHYHHEHWDGLGYPDKLKGEEIPLSARIFSIVDIYDALLSNRPYRLAWTKDQTFHYIIEQSGKIFDPHVVQVFLSLFR